MAAGASLPDFPEQCPQPTDLVHQLAASLRLPLGGVEVGCRVLEFFAQNRVGFARRQMHHRLFNAAIKASCTVAAVNPIKPRIGCVSCVTHVVASLTRTTDEAESPPVRLGWF